MSDPKSVQPEEAGREDGDDESTNIVDPSFETLLDYLARTRGFDFRVYKRAALMRRFAKRLKIVDVDDFAAYADYLEVHPDEFAHLFNAVLINVTAFFRDPSSWTFVQDEVVPKILAHKGPDEPVRVWTAGCASGEETYSIAMVLAEAMGPEAFHGRVKIYGSDIDDDALRTARAGSYEFKRMKAVPERYGEKYFEIQRDRAVFNSQLRRSIIFGRHNVVQDAPISRLDLLICRNTLMYFNAETQAQVLTRFNFALSDTGYLFLGRAEMLIAHSKVFSPVNLGHRIFMRSAGSARERLAPSVRDAVAPAFVTPNRLRDAAVEHSPLAILGVDITGTLVLANARARALFGLASRDVGQPFSNLKLPQSPVDLRPLIQAAYGDGLPVVVSGGDLRSSVEAEQRRVHVQPLRDEDGNPEGVIIAFEDLSHQHRLQVDVARAEGEIKRLQEDLEATSEELESTTGELETTNEELQSSNEELETTNEELQSANEELETMNEELSSTNEELQATNEELRQRSTEADRASGFAESILEGMQIGVVVLDGSLRILNWSARAEDLWGLRADEVRGQSLMGLEIGLPLDQLRQPMRSVLAGDGAREALSIEATNRRGKKIQCRVTLSPLVADGHGPDGVIILMEERDPGPERS